MKNNKKLYFIIPLVIAFILLIGVYVYLNNDRSTAFSSSERKWLQNNSNVRENIETINDYPVYGDGGVFDNFIEFLEEDTNLEFNRVPYYRETSTTTKDFKFRVLKDASELGTNDLLLSEDVYVAIGKSDKKIDQISDFENITFGVFNDDVGSVSYYLKKGKNLSYKSYSNSTKLFDALDNSKVDMIIIPNIMYLDSTISNNDYHINYVFTEISNKIVLTLSSTNDQLNGIVKKSFNKWKSEEFVDVYNKVLLDYYIEKNNINDKTKAEILSKTYTYGYVDNYPYEALIRGEFVGISAEYINRISRLSGIDFEFKKYESYSDLKKAIDNKEVDIAFNYYNFDFDNYYKTVSTFVERYSVLSNTKNSYVVNSFESLKGKQVNTLDNTALNDYLKSNSKAKVVQYSNLKKLLKNSDDKLIVIDSETYNYYRNTKFKDYELLYNDVMTNDYNFLVTKDCEDFYKLFNYVINTNSYYNYRNSGLNSLNVSIINKASFRSLYMVLLSIVLIPLLLLVVFLMIFNRKKKTKEIKKAERKKYTDMLTSLKNRNYLTLNIKNWNENPKYPQAIVVIDLNNVNYVNDNYGYESGDKLIVKAASLLVNTQLEKSEIIRTDGNEFLIYLVGYSEQQIAAYTKKLAKEMRNLPYGFGGSIGYSMIMDEIKTIDDAINEATLDMKTNKEEYK